jgi:hypothetical protein
MNNARMDVESLNILLRTTIFRRNLNHGFPNENRERRVISSTMLRRVVWYKIIDVSEEDTAFIHRVK